MGEGVSVGAMVLSGLMVGVSVGSSVCVGDGEGVKRTTDTCGCAISDSIGNSLLQEVMLKMTIKIINRIFLIISLIVKVYLTMGMIKNAWLLNS